MTRADGTEMSLIERMKRGCDQSFARLIVPQALPLRVLIRQIAGAAARADFDEEDMFQVVVFRAWQLRDSFEDLGPGSFQRWMVKLARNIIGDRLRYLGSKGRDATRRQIDAASLASAIPGSITSVASKAARTEDVNRLEEAMTRLDECERELIQLYYLEGLSLAEVAAQTGRAKATVWKEVRRSLERLRGDMAN